MKKKSKNFFDFFDFFRKGQKTKKIKKNQENEKNPGPWVSPRGGFLAVGIPPSRILSGSRLEPLTLPAGAPWIFLIFLIFFFFLIFLIFFEKPKK